MNVRPYTLLNKRGDKQYGYVHALAPDSPTRLTECGKRTDTALGYWDEIDEPVNCPKCLKKMG
jgi:hypothetical protein